MGFAARTFTKHFMNKLPNCLSFASLASHIALFQKAQQAGRPADRIAGRPADRIADQAAGWAKELTRTTAPSKSTTTTTLAKPLPRTNQ